MVLACFIAYLPAINNSFISDDFTLMRFLEDWQRDPWKLWNAVSELFRAMSYVYFRMTFALFGKVPELHYVASIGLHIVTSLLAFRLVRTLTGRTLAAWVAASFFAVYARHEEAVMWISANNSTILTLSCLLFLNLWESYRVSKSSWRTYVAALAVLVMALFAKETAVILVPLALFTASLDWPLRKAIRESGPLLLICIAYGLFWVSQSYRNFFIVDGHYSVSSHFFTVYFLSLSKQLASLLPFVGAVLLAYWWNRRKGLPFSWKLLQMNHVGLFFCLWIGLAFVPISFLTYARYVASRNTYLPSVALAGLVGVLAVTLIDNTKPAFRPLWTVLIAAVLVWNVQYIWRKQDREYVKRAAPTQQLIALLNRTALPELPLEVCGFPLHPSIGSAAVVEFTALGEQDVLFLDDCDSDDAVFARWSQERHEYDLQFPESAKQ